MVYNLTEFAEFVGVSRKAIYRALQVGRVKRRRDKKFDTRNPDNESYIAVHKKGECKPSESVTLPAKSVTLRHTSLQCKPPKSVTLDRAGSHSKPRKKNGGKKRSAKKTAKKPARKRKTPAARKRSKRGASAAKPAPKPTAPKVPKSSNHQVSESSSNGNGSGSEKPTRSQAELDKLLVQIEQLEVKTEKERQSLISRDLVRAVLGRLYMIDVNEFITIGANIASEVVGAMGIDDDAKIMQATKMIEDKLYSVLQHKKRLVNDFLEDIKAEILKGDESEA